MTRRSEIAPIAETPEALMELSSILQRLAPTAVKLICHWEQEGYDEEDDFYRDELSAFTLLDEAGSVVRPVSGWRIRQVIIRHSNAILTAFNQDYEPDAYTEIDLRGL